MIGWYIIYSESIDKFYIGSTSDFNSRLLKHNNHFYGINHFTNRAEDWTLFVFIPTINYPHAQRIEKLIKKMKSRNYIQNLKKYPDIILKIAKKTK